MAPPLPSQCKCCCWEKQPWATPLPGRGSQRGGTCLEGVQASPQLDGDWAPAGEAAADGLCSSAWPLQPGRMAGSSPRDPLMSSGLPGMGWGRLGGPLLARLSLSSPSRGPASCSLAKGQEEQGDKVRAAREQAEEAVGSEFRLCCQQRLRSDRLPFGAGFSGLLAQMRDHPIGGNENLPRITRMRGDPRAPPGLTRPGVQQGGGPPSAHLCQSPASSWTSDPVCSPVLPGAPTGCCSLGSLWLFTWSSPSSPAGRASSPSPCLRTHR